MSPVTTARSLINPCKPKGERSGVIDINCQPINTLDEAFYELVLAVAKDFGTEIGVPEINCSDSKESDSTRIDNTSSTDPSRRLRPMLTPKAFAQTYSPNGYEERWEMADEYLLAMERAEKHSTAGPQEIADTLGLPESRVQYWREGSKPRVMQKLEAADNHGWFDSTWGSDIFRAFNFIVAAVFSGGHLEPYSQVSITPGTEQSLLARALAALGAPVGQKNEESEIELPEYLSTAPAAVRREFVELYAVLRRTRRDDGTVDIVEERPRSYLEPLGVLLEDAAGETATVQTNGVWINKRRQKDFQRRSGGIATDRTPNRMHCRTPARPNAASLLRNAAQ